MLQGLGGQELVVVALGFATLSALVIHSVRALAFLLRAPESRFSCSICGRRIHPRASSCARCERSTILRRAAH
jgi:hypothetical protein